MALEVPAEELPDVPSVEMDVGAPQEPDPFDSDTDVDADVDAPADAFADAPVDAAASAFPPLPEPDLALDDDVPAADRTSLLDGLAAQMVEASDMSAPNSAPEPPALRSDDHFVDLAEWLRDTEPAGNEAPDEFSAMLETFKRGVAESMDDGDSESHYDLGLAYKEMGLHAEAIAQFEMAIRGVAPIERRVRAYESLGECHLEAHSYETAISALTGALAEPELTDDKSVGVLYLLGYATECLGRWTDALAYYARVAVIDPAFRDIEQRIRHARRATQSADV
jgi:tetratricopeptide (TPR) repeat protein